MVRDEQPGGPYLEAIRRAFQFARAQGRACDPADFLVGLAALPFAPETKGKPLPE